MPWTVIDYSPVFYAELRGDPVPRQRDGKFVVIENGRHRYAVFAPRELASYHAHIAERFLTLQGISGWYGGKHDVYWPLSDAWKIKGGGHWTLDEDASWLRIFGESQAYGPVNLESLAKVLRQAAPFGPPQDIAVG